MNPLPPPPPRAGLAAGVGRAGFRKWYERELLSGHAHMVLALFSLIGLIGSLEALSGADNLAVHALAAIASAVIGLWAGRRYMNLMVRAEYVAHQATCTDCGEYGRFEVLGGHGAQAQVRCRRCSHRWMISED